MSTKEKALSSENSPEELFQKYVVDIAMKKGIDATAGSGPEILYVLKNEMAGKNLSAQEIDVIKNNLVKITNQIIEDLRNPPKPFTYKDDQFRFHEWSLFEALKKLCPIFPFCK